MTSGDLKEAGLVPSPVEDITLIRWDQKTLLGRLQHFSRITDTRLLLKSRKDVEAAQTLYQTAKYAPVAGPLCHHVDTHTRGIILPNHSQGGLCSVRHDPWSAVQCTDSLPLCRAPRHTRSHAPSRQDECTGPLWHGPHRNTASPIQVRVQ